MGTTPPPLLSLRLLPAACFFPSFLVALIFRFPFTRIEERAGDTSINGDKLGKLDQRAMDRAGVDGRGIHGG